MRRGQISMDLLFAVTIISLTVVSLMNVALSEKIEVENFGRTAQLKLFAIDVRDTIARVYSAGSGMMVVKSSPLILEEGEWINITAFKNGTLKVLASIGGREYIVVERLQISPGNTSSVLLTADSPNFRIETREIPGGGIEVILAK
ncbi:hypothetical protein [Thermococcus sp.]|uniref:hypothetical protein n=1 Tax=Thermococcus sp. TaxID=35749 RepID=UPI0026242E5C|nr:hypothetical protein [Thermococcus sp.]